MIQYEKFILDNGLRVLVHEDKSTPMAVLNVLYDVGAKDEHPDKTGFAHLFEHLMFGGSKNVASFDQEIEHAGGQNNAFTNNNTKLNETIFFCASFNVLTLMFFCIIS